MNAYFFNISNEERESIKNLHKETYDGYVTQSKGNMYPLTVEDMAKDKAGVTVNNKGEVSEYKNFAINEMRFDGKSTGLFQNEEDNYLEVGAPLDMIADRQDDVKHGTVDFDDEIENFDLGYITPFDDELHDDVCPECGMVDCQCDHDDEFHHDLEDIEDDELIIKLNESLDMFKRFKKYN